MRVHPEDSPDRRAFPRRRFLGLALAAVAAGLLLPLVRGGLSRRGGRGAAGAGSSAVFIVRNGTPQENVRELLALMGGIERFVGPRDIVLLKPNAQWWNQGRTNLAAMKGFIDLVLAVPGFAGEVIVCENQHFMDESLPEEERDNIRGWTHESEINGDIDGVNHTLNSLIGLYRERGVANVTKRHWRDGGPKPDVTWGNGRDGGLVSGPAEGDGYVWTEEEYTYSPLFGLKTWKVRMSYPVFTSAFSGITVDLKRGAFRRDGRGGGDWLPDRPVKLVNFPVLNAHPRTGVTSSIKNYMGITDLSCGYARLQPEGTYTVHMCGGKYFRHAKAGPIGHFMKTIRRADLNVVTAEWVGWGDRTDPAKASRAQAVLGGLDPIALDYVGAKRFILPLSGDREHHDPDRPGSTFRKFLDLALESSGMGTLDEARIEIHEVDLARRA